MALCKGNQYSKHRYASATLACLHICASGGHTGTADIGCMGKNYGKNHCQIH